MLQKQRLLIGDQKIWDGNEIHYYLMNSSMQYDFWLSVNPKEVMQSVQKKELQFAACPQANEEGWQVRSHYTVKELLTKYAYVVDDFCEEAFEKSQDYVDYQNMVRPHIHNLMHLAKQYNQNALRCGYIRNVIDRYNMIVDGMRQTQTVLLAV